MFLQSDTLNHPSADSGARIKAMLHSSLPDSPGFSWMSPWLLPGTTSHGLQREGGGGGQIKDADELKV